MDTANSGTAADRQTIRDLIENWAIWRDALMWDRFRTVWHKEGRHDGDLVPGHRRRVHRRQQEGYERAFIILHFLGGTIDRRQGQARHRADQDDDLRSASIVDGVLCDVVCTGRFYDFLEKRKGKWGMVLRQPIYERDRLNPVDPTQTPKLDQTLLASFPEGYRHLAYLQTQGRLQGEAQHARASTGRWWRRSTPAARSG